MTAVGVTVTILTIGWGNFLTMGWGNLCIMQTGNFLYYAEKEFFM
jgi:hypothetical protein